MRVPQEPSIIETPLQGAQKAALGDYLAAERTLLAWIRTGLALMGFGFVVARFCFSSSSRRFAALRQPSTRASLCGSVPRSSPWAFW
jgi:uncharacterized membrane protein YidH (DUF202 family)